MHADFYRHFEDQFRASRKTIKERLSFYAPFLRVLREVMPTHYALDLGCGRGEWLELLHEMGFEAQGVDLDEGMLTACRDRGLPASRRDAVTALQEAPDNTLSLVSAFHLIEHLPFEDSMELIHQALRSLIPGGLLILETPNPENLSVGTSTFYLDPTHRKPVPHALLSFMTAYCGFARQKVVRLNEDPNLAAAHTPTVKDLIFGVSPDYAVIAQKSAEPFIIANFSNLYENDYGLAIETLADRYERHLASQFAQLQLQAIEAVSNSEQALLSTDHALKELDSLRRTHHDLTSRLEAVYQSTSWRVTRPLRAIGRIWFHVKHQGPKGALTPFIHYINANPKRRAIATKWLTRLRLKRLARRIAAHSRAPASAANAELPPVLQVLPPEAREIESLIATRFSSNQND